MRAFADLLAPVRCASCGAPSDGDLCGGCARDVTVLLPPWCRRCGTPGVTDQGCPACAALAGFRSARSLVVFARPARSLVLTLKRRGRPALGAAVGGLLGRLAQREGLAAGLDAVTWVPGGRTARHAGFDHMRLVATGAADELGLDAVPLLRRAEDGPRQADVPLEMRRRNVRTRFASERAPSRVLLLDDVFTTGATAEACALALQRAGASSVDVVTWARTLRRRPAPATTGGARGAAPSV